MYVYIYVLVCISTLVFTDQQKLSHEPSAVLGPSVEKRKKELLFNVCLCLKSYRLRSISRYAGKVRKNI